MISVSVILNILFSGGPGKNPSSSLRSRFRDVGGEMSDPGVANPLTISKSLGVSGVSGICMSIS